MAHVAALTASALLLAGLASSPHCLLMCGSLQALQTRGQGHHRDLLWLNVGRIAGYAVLGAAAGAVGAVLLLRLPGQAIGLGIQLLSGLVLVLIGLWYLRNTVSHCGGHARSSTRTDAPLSVANLLWRGLIWSMLPCGLLYGVLFLAAASGGMLKGLVLMAAFGIGTAPLMLLGGSALRRLLSQPRLRIAAAALLIAMGSGSISAVLVDGTSSAWCRSAIAFAR